MKTLKYFRGLSPRGSESNQIGLRIVPEAVAATETLTLTGLPVADEIVTIGTRVYTWKAVPAAANEVDIGASATISIDNLIAAIMNTAGEGTTYGTGTLINDDVFAVQGAGDTMDVTARRLGTVGNSIVTTTDMFNASWGSSPMSGGVDHGTTPTNSTNWLQLCYLTENLAANQSHDRSERICAATGPAARMTRKRTISSSAPGGTVTGELSYSPVMHELIRAAMNQEFVPHIDVAGEFRSYVGVGLQTYTIEKYYDELPGKFEVWTGMVLSQLTITIPAEGKATWSAVFLGRTHDATPVTSAVGSGSVAADPDNEIMSGATDFANLEFDDAPIPNLIPQSMVLDINNNARGLQGLGSLGPAEHRFGDATITGSLPVFFGVDAYALYLEALANTNKKLDHDLVDPAGNTYHIEIPTLNFTGDPPSSGGRNQDVTLPLPFEAHTDLVFIARDDA